MLASLASGAQRGGPAGGAGGMRELDAEAPVIWPAWCYSAESGVVASGERARTAAVARRCVRDPPPAQLAYHQTHHQPPPLHQAPPAQHTLPPLAPVKSERLSPAHVNYDNRSSASRSRSVTPSTSSYPGTPPERDASPAAPHPPAPHAPAPHPPARNYSDIMRSLAARYNHAPPPTNDFFHPARNGFASALDARLGLAKVAGGLAPGIPLLSGSPGNPLGSIIGTGTNNTARTSPVSQPDGPSDQPVGGLFAGFSGGQGGPQRVPAFPVMMDMSSTKTLLAIAKVTRGSAVSARNARRNKRPPGGPEHCPLDLSAGAELAKRARRSPGSSASHTPSPASPRHDHDERRSDTESREERDGRVCDCAGGCDRLAAWAVDDVCEFVQSIDICAEYAPNFREQRIDGSGLPLLTEDHLTGMLQMKLGPALKLKAMLNKKLSSCHRCQSPHRQERHNGSASSQSSHNNVKSEPNSNSSSPS